MAKQVDHSHSVKVDKAQADSSSTGKSHFGLTEEMRPMQNISESPRLAGQFDTRGGKSEEAISTPPSSLVRNVFLVRPCRPKWQLQLASLQVAVTLPPSSEIRRRLQRQLTSMSTLEVESGALLSSWAQRRAACRPGGVEDKTPGRNLTRRKCRSRLPGTTSWLIFTRYEPRFGLWQI